jgi:hypothetical protein
MQAKEKQQMKPKQEEEEEEEEEEEREQDLKLDQGEQNSDPHTETFDGNWRNEAEDNSLRRRVMVNMYKLLITEFKKKDKYSVEWKHKLPVMVRHLESMHYRKSPSREVYMDVCPRKMKKRLRSLAHDIYMEKKRTQKSATLLPK